VIPAAGGESRELFRSSHWTDETLYNSLAWTPDQKFLVFAQGNGVSGGTKALWKVPVAGGQAQPVGISLPAEIKSLQIDPDGKRIFFSGTEKSPYEVWTLENFLPKPASAE
jgi:WD40 repeat protein